MAAAWLIDQHHRFGVEFPRLLDDDLPAIESTQHGDLESFRVKCDDRERAAADAARRPEDGDALHG